jgi:LPS sulfotransferase NodH
MKISLRVFLKLKKIKQNILVLLSQNKLIKSNDNLTKFIILSRSRSGSNLLVSLLDSHPNIYVRGEVFHNLRGRNYKKILKSFFYKMPNHFQACGFKIFYYHPLDTDCNALWEELVKNKDIKVIHLYRKNLLKTVISRKIAIETDIWSSEKTKLAQIPKFEFPPKLIEEEIKKSINWRNKYNKLFNNHHIIELSYEDMIKSLNDDLFFLQEFLGLSKMKLYSHLEKQQKKSLSQVLSNYTEIEEYFSTTKWKKYF